MGGQEGWCDPVILKLDYLEIFEVKCNANIVCRYESSLSNIFSKKSHENRMFLQFFYVKNNVCQYFTNDHFSIYEGVLTLWRHSDVKHKWLVLILVSMKRRCPYLLGCVEKHFFPWINLKLPENCPWVCRSMFHPGNRFP